MASRISALNHYRPMIEYGYTVGWHEVAKFIADRSTVSAIDMIAILEGIHAAIIFFSGDGRGVRLEGLGTYLPQINYKGEFSLSYRPDPRLKEALNASNFSGKLINKRYIGMSSEQIVALWNSEHPEDPVEE